MYCFDTNAFMEWWDRRYPTDVFPSVEPQMDGMVAARKLFAPERVKDEIEQVASDGLQAWAARNRGIFIAHEEALQSAANEVQRQFPALIDRNAVHDEADRYVIALAQMRGLAVVTHETPASAKRRARGRLFIPDVCASLGIECIELLEVMRREGWAF